MTATSILLIVRPNGSVWARCDAEDPNARAAARNLGDGATLVTALTGSEVYRITADRLNESTELPVATSRTPGGFLYRQSPHLLCGSDSERQSVGDPGHCEDCASVGHLIAHPDLSCGDVGCHLSHDDNGVLYRPHGGPSSPVDRSPAVGYRDIAETLQVAIVSGELAAGSKVPGENELMETHGVSQITARRALEVLKNYGLVVARKGSGTYVAEGAADRAAEVDQDAVFGKHTTSIVIKNDAGEVTRRIRIDHDAPAFVFESDGDRVVRLTAVRHVSDRTTMDG